MSDKKVNVSDIARQVIAEMQAEDPEQFRVKASAPTKKGKTLSPSTVALLGGLADAGSTYAFAKTGKGRETNPLVTAIAGNSPEMTGLTALGGLAATKGVTALIRKLSPKAADAIAANLGTEQLALAVNNANIAAGRKSGDSFSRYGDAMVRGGIEESRKKHGGR